MTLYNMKVSVRPRRWASAWVALTAILVWSAAPAWAWKELDPRELAELEQLTRDPQSNFVVDGSYVMSAGNLHMNITNIGLIGSWFSSRTTLSNAPSAQWPAGSEDEYLWEAGLWIGGVQLSERLVSTMGAIGGREIRAQRNPEDTIYEAIDSKLIRPLNTQASGYRYPDPRENDDEDFDEYGVERIDEEVLNGYDDDDDGLIDEDFAQIGNQMMVTTMYDNTRLAIEAIADHTPLNLKVVQSSYAWEGSDVNDFVGFDFTITNVGVTDITNIYLGLFADCDLMNRSSGAADDDMVGSFSGAVRASDGSFVPVEVGYMWDDPEEGARLDGYFGVAFLGHDTDPAGVRAPKTVKLHSFRHFSQQASYDQGGDPTKDSERYEVMSSGEIQPNAVPGKRDDYRFIVAAGPFLRMRPDESLSFQIAFVAGLGLDGLLRNCAEAALTYYGSYFNRDDDPDTGVNGRETVVCREDFSNFADFEQIYPDVGDQTCIDADYLQENFSQITEDDVFQLRDPRDPTRLKTCAMVNMDNCLECFRQRQFSSSIYQFAPNEERCRQIDIETTWNCWDTNVGLDQKAGCTGIGGNEFQLRWLVGMAPPAPGLRVWPVNRQVHVFWDNKSEVTADVRIGQVDFQSYRIWRADNWTRPFGSSLQLGPGVSLWQLIAEYDVVDSFVVDHFNASGGLARRDTLALGRNTGLDHIRYVPRVLSDSRFIGLADSMQRVVDADSLGAYTERPPLFDRATQDVLPISLPVIHWRNYPAALDTFWAVAGRAAVFVYDPESGQDIQVVAPKTPTWYYEYIDADVHNGFLYFYSVTATDHVLEYDAASDIYINRGAGLVGSPTGSFTYTSPGTFSQSAADRAQHGNNIFVYPNPATREALLEFQQFSPADDDPTGVRVRFANLPAARNTIKIFTLAGDLVETIAHDGTGGYGEASWNLISRNGQEIVSGIYLYVVQSDDAGFEDFIGKFVVVR